MTANRERAATAPAEMTFPALFMLADQASNKWQRSYLALIRTEYLLLLLAAILSLNFTNARWFYGLYAVVFVTSLIVLLLRTERKPEQDWYRCRALAESVKTSTWRYVMRAEPFAGEYEQARRQFRDMLAQLLRSNEHIGEKLAGDHSHEDQTTPMMETVRSWDWRKRRDYYVEHRIRDQRHWYSRKATDNASMASQWRNTGIGVYLIALVLVICRIIVPEWQLWPIEPVIVAASAVLGWVQTKKFSELSSIYTLTALEIGISEGKLKDVDDEAEFSEFVNEAELAFSREHTQWVARQTNKY